MELLAESYDRTFDLPMGRVGVMADIYVEDDRIELRDLIVYAIGVEKLQVGVQYMLFVRRQIEKDIRAMGYASAYNHGDRISGASPGRKVGIKETL
jgi:hypothetical protein